MFQPKMVVFLANGKKILKEIRKPIQFC